MNRLPSVTDTLLIRPADGRDTDVVYRFLCELEGQRLDPTAFRAVFRRNLTNGDIHYLVAEQAGEVVGFVSCHVQYLLHHAGRVGEIQELFVRADYRNQGVGYQLVTAVDVLARQRSFTTLEVTANRVRVDTHRFYEQAGFTATHYKFVKPCLVCPRPAVPPQGFI